MSKNPQNKTTKHTNKLALIKTADALDDIYKSLSGNAAAQAIGLAKHCRNLANPQNQNTQKE